MKSKGFTLVEVLGVMTLLAIIFALVYPNVMHMMDQGKQTEYEEYKTNIYLAAEAYVNSDASASAALSAEGASVSIPYETLLANGFLNSGVVNPKTGASVSENATLKSVVVTVAKNKTFTYSIQE